MIRVFRKAKKSLLISTLVSLSVIVFCIARPTPLFAESRLLRDLKSLANFVDSLIISNFNPAHMRKKLSKVAYHKKYHAVIQQAARENKLDPWLIHAIIQRESDYDQYAQSDKGAQGLMQLMPGTQKDLGVTNPWDPAQNINGGARYYRSMLNKFDGSYRIALQAYNAGMGKVMRGNIPSESHDYAKKVLATWQRLKKENGS